MRRLLLTGLNDTVYGPPGETARLITAFAHYADVATFHCHILEHEDRGMMGPFVVVRPGQRPGPEPRHHR